MPSITIEIDIEARIDRKQLRFMGDAAAYAQIALEDAIQQAGLTPEQVSHPRTGLIMGSGGGSPANQIEAADTLREKGIRRVGPYQVTRCMSSTVSACLATNFKVKGINYSITSACSTSAHCIGAAAQQIAWGLQDVMFAGGGEELSWGMSLLFDGMGAMSAKYNATPEKASRAYDANRDGFVIAGGGGAVVPPSLVARFGEIAACLAPPPGPASQSAIAAFMRDGHYLRHLRRTKRTYAAQRDALLKQLAPRAQDFDITTAGLAIALQLPRGASDLTIIREMLPFGLTPAPLSRIWHA